MPIYPDEPLETPQDSSLPTSPQTPRGRPKEIQGDLMTFSFRVLKTDYEKLKGVCRYHHWTLSEGGRRALKIFIKGHFNDPDVNRFLNRLEK